MSAASRKTKPANERSYKSPSKSRLASGPNDTTCDAPQSKRIANESTVMANDLSYLAYSLAGTAGLNSTGPGRAAQIPRSDKARNESAKATSYFDRELGDNSRQLHDVGETDEKVAFITVSVSCIIIYTRKCFSIVIG